MKYQAEIKKMKALMMMALGCACLMAGCRSENLVKAPEAKIIVQQPEVGLNEEQRRMLEEWTFNIKTKNSVADIDRLKDSLKRWDELFIKPSAPEMKPVFVILKERVKERLTELEKEAKATPN